MRGSLGQKVVRGRERGSQWNSWHPGGVRVRRRYPFSGASQRFDLNDAINSPGFPGSSTYYFNGLGEQVSTQAPKSIWANITENLSKITSTAVPAYMQYRVFKQNLKRADQGQAPLDPRVYAPAARVEFDAGPQMQSMARTAGFGIGGMALVGVGLYLLLRRR